MMNALEARAAEIVAKKPVGEVFLLHFDGAVWTAGFAWDGQDGLEWTEKIEATTASRAIAVFSQRMRRL